MTTRKEKLRIAVIGTGLAGLTAAHLLAAKEEDIGVHVFEKAAGVGMDAAGIDVRGDDGQIYRVDSPMRAIQGGYYKRLLRLYESLGVELVKSNFTYSFSELTSSEKRGSATSKSSPRAFTNTSTFIYNGGNGLSLRPVSFPSSLSGATSPSPDILSHTRLPYVPHLHYFAQVLLYAVSYLYLLLIAFYHVYSGHTSQSSEHWISSSTLSQFLSCTPFLSSSFSSQILIPLLSCVATCSPTELLNYPISELLEYIVYTFGTDHYLVQGGIRNVVNKLIEKIPRQSLHFDCELVSIRRSANDRGKKELRDSEGRTWEFEHVIFATQANQAKRLMEIYLKSLEDENERDLELLAYEKRRIEALNKFGYTKSTVVNHYDSENTMVEQESDRRILNLSRWSREENASSAPYRDEKSSFKDTQHHTDRSHIMATHDLSILHPALCAPPPPPSKDCPLGNRHRRQQPLLQTTNPTVHIDPTKILSSKTFERAIVTLQSRKALRGFLYPSHKATSMGNRALEEIDDDDEGVENMQGRQGIWFVGAWAAEVNFKYLRTFPIWNEQLNEIVLHYLCGGTGHTTA